jgi:hypothetical protein
MGFAECNLKAELLPCKEVPAMFRPMADSSDDQQSKADGISDCTIPPVIPPEVAGRYSPIRDPDLERDVSNYVERQAGETVVNVEKIKTEYVIGDTYDIWDVTTAEGQWWVISNLMNLYPKNLFPSLDYTLSFHIGLMMRMRSRPSGPDAAEPDPFDEVARRREQAEAAYERAVEAVDYQAVGMQLRECLISLSTALRRRMEVVIADEPLQEANFKGWMELMINQLCPGEPNKELRQFLKTTTDKTWSLVNWLTHDRNANQTAASIALHACDMVFGHSIQILVRDRTDNIEQCPICSSRNIRSHYDVEIPPDGDYYSTCGECGWSNHPDGADRHAGSS